MPFKARGSSNYASPCTLSAYQQRIFAKFGHDT